jgi:hypothetical protein
MYEWTMYAGNLAGGYRPAAQEKKKEKGHLWLALC